MFQADTNTQSPLQKSALNFVAEALWEDFEAGRPIDGGVAFEAQLRQCRLDGSLGSLQRLDKFLLYIRRNINESARAFMSQDKNRILLWFIGFYAGNVLAKTWQSTPNWLGRHEIASRYGYLTLDDNNPFALIALDYLPKSQHKTAEYKYLFFVLEPIGQVVWGDASAPLPSVLGDAVESGLFDAVVKRMPEPMRQKVMAMQARADAKNHTATKQHATKKVAQPINSTAGTLTDTTTDSATTIIAPSSPAVSNKPVATQTTQAILPADSRHVTATPASTPPASTTPAPPPTTTSKPALASSQKTTAHLTNKTPKPLIRQDDFTPLRAELVELDAPLTQSGQGAKQYDQASRVLDKFDTFIAKSLQSGTPADKVQFAPAQKKTRLQALKLLNQAAQSGNTSAMLKLAIYYFLGEGIPKNEQKGFAWVQRAANENDIRAQRQLSRLYYQGLGHEQDMDMGRHWLEKAAENGHQEASTLLEHWNNAQTVMNEHRFDQTVNQRYIILGALLTVVVLIVLILV